MRPNRHSDFDRPNPGTAKTLRRALRGDCPACGAHALRRSLGGEACRCVVCGTTFCIETNRVTQIVAACFVAGLLALVVTFVLGRVVPPTPILLPVSFVLLFIVFLAVSIIAIRRLVRGLSYLRS